MKINYKFRSPIYRETQEPINQADSLSCEFCFFPKATPHNCNGDIGDFSTIIEGEEA